MSALPDDGSDDPRDRRAFREFDARQEAAGTCHFCGRPVEAGKDFRRVFGWVGGRGSDGFKRDGYGDEWAHKHCIEVNRTVGAGQGGLFDA